MPHFDRGVYEPSDELRVFDGAEDDEDVEGSRLPLLIVLALLVLAMFAGVVWLAYTQGVARGRTETPVLTAENGPARISPQNPGGVEQPYKGFKIYEQPAPPDDAVDSPTTPSAPAAKPAPVVAASASPPPVVKPAPAPKIAVATPAPPSAKPAPVATMPAPKPVAVPAAPLAKIARPAPKIAVVSAAPAPKAVAATPAPPKPAAVVSSPLPAAPAGPATGAPRSLALVPSKPVPPLSVPSASTPAASPPVSASGSYVLQIGAYKSQADADAAWKAYKAKHAALLAGSNDDIQQADLGDKGTWYRLRITGFPSKDVASALCDRLKADGGGCFLGK